MKQKQKEKLLAGSGTERVVVAILRLHQLWETWYLQCFWHLGKLKMHAITIITVCFGFCLCFLKEKNMFICFSRFGGSENWKIMNHLFWKWMLFYLDSVAFEFARFVFCPSSHFFTWAWVRCQQPQAGEWHARFQFEVTWSWDWQGSCSNIPRHCQW